MKPLGSDEFTVEEYRRMMDGRSFCDLSSAAKYTALKAMPTEIAIRELLGLKDVIDVLHTKHPEYTLLVEELERRVGMR